MKRMILLGAILIGCAKAPDNNADIETLKSQVAQLQNDQSSTTQSIQSITVQLNQSMGLISTIQKQLAEVVASSAANEYQAYELGEMINNLQTVVMNQQSAITQLSTGQAIVKLIDFCDTAANVYNEIGFRLSDGRTVVFFESGGSRFLTVLKASASYQTTDGTNCKFTTNAQGLVCDSLGCR